MLAAVPESALKDRPLWTRAPRTGIVFRMIVRRSVFLACLFVTLSACDGPVVTPPTDAGTDAGPPEDLLRPDCEALVPEFCALPWPSDYFLADDPSTPTGHRLAVGATTLPQATVRGRSTHIDPAPLATRDGWSVNASILAYLPGATATGLPSPANIGLSLEDGSPTVLMNAQTGERVPHFSEIDESVGDPEAPRTFIVRPVVPLEHATRYIVAIRGVVDAGGAVIPASETFAALRDGTDSDLAYITQRREHFEALFGTLETNGVTRSDLQLAWDFTTSSLQDDTGWMLAVRDATLAAIGDDGPDFRIESIEEFTPDQNANIARRVHVMMTVPSFLTGTERTDGLNFGADGMPEQNGTIEFPIVVNIPRNATPDTPVRPIQYGHGLLGSREQANAGWLAEFGNANGFMPFGTDWIGMADIDYPTVVLSISSGHLEDFHVIPERLVQGIVNALSAMRLMLGAFGNHPDLLVDGRSVVDTSAGFYTGDSQGGIFGGTYMAITTDVERGILGVPGQPYNLLLNRSVDFDPYLTFARMAYRDGVDIQLVLNYLQQLWDRAEPGSYTRHIMNDPLPGTPTHQVILQAAIGDHQVTTLGAHIMARAIGAVAIRPQTRPMWNIEEVDGPHVGSAIVEFEYGVPEPITNTPPRDGEDPHGSVRRNPRALEQTLHFYQTGEIIHTCDGICDPE